MAKSKTRFTCRECGYKSPKWLGRCPQCQSWESFEEETVKAVSPAEKNRPAGGRPTALSEVAAEELYRLSTGLSELDRVLGGGLAPGAVTLLSGEPGVGKSTLLLQAAAGLARKGRRLLYVTGEESAAQVRLRAERLGLDLASLWVMAETRVEDIARAMEAERWDVAAVDSIQTLASGDLAGGAGSPGQVRESAGRLGALAKSLNLPLWLVGHITKDGSIAGPKLLEHLVDTVLYFEGDRERALRLLRAFKNRFGSVNEIGVFEMTGRGLGEVTNPSALFLSERPHEASGSVVAPIMEGQRPLLMEIQALVSASPLAMPRRQALGVDAARVGLLAAVLEKKVRLKLFDRDIFVNVAGGARISEPAADLAIVAAMAGSWADRPAPDSTIFVGEVGLAGEIRSVAHLEARLREAKKMGFHQAVTPPLENGKYEALGLKLKPVKTVAQLLRDHLGFERR
ncbi:DNA repair protein RadA [Deltaproteobacteria bacterium OttesenSCG-928-M10]|nr:DNA repair protein RadA [Deltaproteobacteria bacterium OttesenSCG-928-M10]